MEPKSKTRATKRRSTAARKPTRTTAKAKTSTTAKPKTGTTAKPGTRTTAKPGTRTTPKPKARTTPKPKARTTPKPKTRATAKSRTTKALPFLMFNDQLGPAVELYTSIFPDSKIVSMAQDGKDGPVTVAEFIVGGQRFMGYNGGPHFEFSQAFSIFISCEDQKEVDRYWNALIKAGAKPVQCGWITDPFGLSWQIVPKRFMELIADPNPKKSQAAMAAMMEMVKLDVAALEKAYDEA